MIAVLAGLSLTALSGGRKKAQALTAATDSIAAIFEQAGTHAISRSTYVWVGLKNTEHNGQDILLVGTIESATGSRQPPPDADDSWLIPVGEIGTFEDIRMVNNPPESSGAAPRPLVPPAGQIYGISQPIRTFSVGSGQNKTTFDGPVIEFNPRGEVTIREAEVAKYLEIGFQQSADGQIVNLKNFTIIQLGTLTGSVVVYRP
jgi:hypothetical protein